MPANLSPQYLEAERNYKQAKTPAEKLQALKEMLALIPKHKGTEKLQADIKRRISKLKEETEKRAKGGHYGHAFNVEKEGAGQIALAGPPNVGKSQLVRALSHATPEVADYPFTTRTPHPAMMQFENVQIQLVDLPPISSEYMEAWVPAIVRTADAVLLVVDLGAQDPLGQVELTLELLEKSKIQLVKDPAAADPWAAVVEKKTWLVGNKLDLPTAEENFEVLQDLYGDRFPLLAVSAETKQHIDALKQAIFDLLEILRVYSKPPGKEPNHSRPFIFKRGSILLDFAAAIHHDFAEKLKFARIWGSDKFDGQRVNKDYRLMDGDVIELHI